MRREEKAVFTDGANAAEANRAAIALGERFLNSPNWLADVTHVEEKWRALPFEKKKLVKDAYDRHYAATQQMYKYALNPDPRSQSLMSNQEPIVRSALNLLNSAIDNLPRQGGKRRHKTPKRRRAGKARKSTFRRRRKH